MAHTHHHHDYSYKVKSEKDLTTVVTVEVPFSEYQSTYEAVLVEMSSNLKLPGFRPGKAPKQKVVEALGSKVASHTLEHILPEVASEILDKEQLNPITQVEYSVTDLAPEKGLQFEFKFLKYPEVKLADFSKLNVEVPPQTMEVPAVEIDDVLKRLFADKNAEVSPETEMEAEESAKSAKKSKKAATAEFDASQLTDEMAQSLKLPDVNTVADLREKIAERISSTKVSESHRKFEEELLKQAIAASKITVPEKLVAERTEAMVNEYIGRISNLGVSIEDFLTAQGMDMDKLREQKRQEAELNIQTDLLLNEIAREHKLIPEVGEIDAEIAAINDPATRNRLQTSEGRRFVLSTLLQQRAFTKLIQLATKDKTK
jgi:trigger factor